MDFYIFAKLVFHHHFGVPITVTVITLQGKFLLSAYIKERVISASVGIACELPSDDSGASTGAPKLSRYRMHVPTCSSAPEVA